MATRTPITPVRRPEGAPGARGRRSLFAGALALACAPTIALAAPNPDAELIELRQHYLEALDAYEASAPKGDPEADPLWHYMERLEAQVETLEPTTMAGVVALCGVAMHWARQPDGRDDFDTAFTGEWPERVVLAVLRIAGGAT